VNFLSGAVDGLIELKKLGFLLVIVTNQRCVARGIVSEDGLREIHARMADELAAQGAKLDAIYYCPHDAVDGCLCRKPKPGMILSAIHAFEEAGIEVEVEKSFMIGDADVLTGKALGMRTGLIGRAPARMSADLYGSSLVRITRQLAGLDKTKEGYRMMSEEAALLRGSLS
jgi:D-glycero-D-manno-heptose 1,7-bisphosphate phosphatase